MRFLEGEIKARIQLGPWDVSCFRTNVPLVGLLAYKDHAKLAQLVPVLPCGIILCAEKDNIVVEYALRSVKKPVGVAEYYLTKKLPKHLRG